MKLLFEEGRRFSASRSTYFNAGFRISSHHFGPLTAPTQRQQRMRQGRRTSALPHVGATERFAPIEPE